MARLEGRVLWSNLKREHPKLAERSSSSERVVVPSEPIVLARKSTSTKDG